MARRRLGSIPWEDGARSRDRLAYDPDDRVGVVARSAATLRAVTIRRGFRHRGDLVREVAGVDPVTRKRTYTDETVAAGVRCRVVHRDDRSVIRDPERPSVILVDHDALHDVGLPFTDDAVLVLDDGRRLSVAGETVTLGGLDGDPDAYSRTPLRQVGRSS